MDCYWPACIHDGLSHCPYLTGNTIIMTMENAIEYPVQLQCGCFTAHAIDGSVALICPDGHEGQLIVAFETREWHMKCGQCPAGKWTGQDRPAAARARSNHADKTGHRQIMLDFLMPDHIKRIWRVHYGSKLIPGKRIVGPRTHTDISFNDTRGVP
jgi:hypothetical protein